jgi:hypothetical protein
MDMQYFLPTFGLVTSHDKGSENSGTFFMHYLILKQMNNIAITNSDREVFFSKMEASKVAHGLYLRTANHPNRSVSHDELTSIIVSSAILNTSHGADVAQYLQSHNGNYPATGESKRYNPSNYFAWYNISGVNGHTFIPRIIYTISLMISCTTAKENTSSKLLYLAELYTLRHKFPGLWEYYTSKMKAQYGEFWVKELFAIYFHTETADYPLIELSRKFDLDF